MGMEDAILRLMQSLQLRQPAEADTVPVSADRDGTASVQFNARPLPALYAVGDVHGMDTLLTDMIAMIEADAAQRGQAATIVFLGDVVNRGPQTRQVLDRILAGPQRASDQWITLRGNHEQIMLNALTRSSKPRFERWLRMGGAATLASYGGSRKDHSLKRALQLIDPKHIAFLSSLPYSHVDNGCLFVHAGVEPGVDLARQSPAKLMSIRGPFFETSHGLPYTVVHGHTPTKGFPLLGPGRIGIDTGACLTGILTAIAIGRNGEANRFFRADAKSPSLLLRGSRGS